jgi:RNA polymerase subunit RPABC4/transcription elongation factor Spt4
MTFLGLAAFAAWLLLRSSRRSAGPIPVVTECPRCGGGVQDAYFRCPHCGTALKTHCPACSRVVETNWSFCPYCSRDVTGSRQAATPQEGESP